MNRLCAIVLLVLVSANAAAEKRIVVLGATQEMDFMQQWAEVEGSELSSGSKANALRATKSDAYIVATKETASLHLLANTLHEADAAIIVVDAAQGPLPHNREHALIARQTRVPTVAIMLANVQGLFSAAPADARELLELIDVETRELLSAYEVGGADTLLFHDARRSAWAPGSADASISDISTVVRGLPSRKRATAAPRTQKSADAQMYFLTDGEAPGYAVSFNDSVSLGIWSEGTSATVTVASAQSVAPGDIAEISINSSKNFSGSAGSRIMLIDSGRIVGIGVITE
jgi:translation elongation factor EF-Tu-like GTPase